jgi:hypothetical protein
MALLMNGAMGQKVFCRPKDYALRLYSKLASQTTILSPDSRDKKYETKIEANNRLENSNCSWLQRPALVISASVLMWKSTHSRSHILH